MASLNETRLEKRLVIRVDCKVASSWRGDLEGKMGRE